MRTYLLTDIKNALAIICLLFSLSSLSATELQLKSNLSLSESIVRDGGTEVQLIFEIENLGESHLANLKCQSAFKTKSKSLVKQNIKLTFLGDPNQNGQLDPGEKWYYVANRNFNYEAGEIYLVSVIGEGEFENQIIQFSDIKQIFNVGVNVDSEVTQVYNEGAVKKLDVTLTSRLLIDEDGAMAPGFTDLEIGNKIMKIALPASKWEARDIRISATGLNNGEPFDPFNPPAGIELKNFCDQDGRDQGRNTNYVLDEADPIQTVRAPCSDFGENDINCEFPDWVFCYTIELPADYKEDSFEITAQDNFSVWKCEEETAGSGKFTEFVDVSDKMKTGGKDVDVKTLGDTVTTTQKDTNGVTGKVSMNKFEVDTDVINNTLFVGSVQDLGQYKIVLFDQKNNIVLQQLIELGQIDYIFELESGKYQVLIEALDGTDRVVRKVQVH